MTFQYWQSMGATGPVPLLTMASSSDKHSSKRPLFDVSDLQAVVVLPPRDGCQVAEEHSMRSCSRRCHRLCASRWVPVRMLSLAEARERPTKQQICSRCLPTQNPDPRW